MIAQRIKAARKLRHKSQEWLAEEIGLTQSSVSLWELGRTDPTEESMERIANALNINVQWLATGEGEMYDSDLYPAVVINLTDDPNNQMNRAEQRMEFLMLFDQLSSSKRKALLTFMKEWIQ